MVYTPLVLLAALLPLALADGPEMEAGRGYGPPWGPGSPPPWAPGRPGGPWQTAAPGPAPADLSCTARAACNSASSAAASCSSRAAATGGAVYNDCLCQAGPSAAIKDCFAGCFGAGGPQWLAQCVPATPAGGGGSTTRPPGGTITGTGVVPTTRASGSGPAPTGSGPLSSRTGTAIGPGPSGNGTASRTLPSTGGPSSSATVTPVRSGASSEMVGSWVASVVGLVFAARLALL
ncbi:hypothetical protein B0T16DRAFT_450173 [Cercophora newfieldiana]|uniref:Extracellular membrane protein CFEM domain-containing protein n=1 Tax=Cercophora newfieldiana TaxID=92897 RepID=A0AA39XSK0_9PEZI|nr:hypothetical protein B0T16DRAFT_450173 [Cercophora newfieldiana]